jgi:hypothetical protein
MNESMVILLAAQHAGDGQAGVYSALAPGFVAGMVVVGLIVLVGILKFIFGGPADPPQDFYYPPSFYDGQDQPDSQRKKADDSKETKS